MGLQSLAKSCFCCKAAEASLIIPENVCSAFQEKSVVSVAENVGIGGLSRVQQDVSKPSATVNAPHNQLKQAISGLLINDGADDEGAPHNDIPGGALSGTPVPAAVWEESGDDPCDTWGGAQGVSPFECHKELPRPPCAWDALLVDHTPVMLTVFDPRVGSVLHQNPRSLAYLGNLTVGGCSTAFPGHCHSGGHGHDPASAPVCFHGGEQDARAARGSTQHGAQHGADSCPFAPRAGTWAGGGATTAATAPSPVHGHVNALELIFLLEPHKLAAMMAELCAGGPGTAWKGIVRVPPDPAALIAAAERRKGRRQPQPQPRHPSSRLARGSGGEAAAAWARADTTRSPARGPSLGSPFLSAPAPVAPPFNVRRAASAVVAGPPSPLKPPQLHSPALAQPSPPPLRASASGVVGLLKRFTSLGRSSTRASTAGADSPAPTRPPPPVPPLVVSSISALDAEGTPKSLLHTDASSLPSGPLDSPMLPHAPHLALQRQQQRQQPQQSVPVGPYTQWVTSRSSGVDGWPQEALRRSQQLPSPSPPHSGTPSGARRILAAFRGNSRVSHGPDGSGPGGMPSAPVSYLSAGSGGVPGARPHSVEVPAAAQLQPMGQLSPRDLGEEETSAHAASAPWPSRRGALSPLVSPGGYGSAGAAEGGRRRSPRSARRPHRVSFNQLPAGFQPAASGTDRAAEPDACGADRTASQSRQAWHDEGGPQSSATEGSPKRRLRRSALPDLERSAAPRSSSPGIMQHGVGWVTHGSQGKAHTLHAHLQRQPSLLCSGAPAVDGRALPVTMTRGSACGVGHGAGHGDGAHASPFAARRTLNGHYSAMGAAAHADPLATSTFNLLMEPGEPSAAAHTPHSAHARMASLRRAASRSTLSGTAPAGSLSNLSRGVCGGGGGGDSGRWRSGTAAGLDPLVVLSPDALADAAAAPSLDHRLSSVGTEEGADTPRSRTAAGTPRPSSRAVMFAYSLRNAPEMPRGDSWRRMTGNGAASFGAAAAATAAAAAAVAAEEGSEEEGSEGSRGREEEEEEEVIYAGPRTQRIRAVVEELATTSVLHHHTGQDSAVVSPPPLRALSSGPCAEGTEVAGSWPYGLFTADPASTWGGDNGEGCGPQAGEPTRGSLAQRAEPACALAPCETPSASTRSTPAHRRISSVASAASSAAMLSLWGLARVGAGPGGGSAEEGTGTDTGVLGRLGHDAESGAYERATHGASSGSAARAQLPNFIVTLNTHQLARVATGPGMRGEAEEAEEAQGVMLGGCFLGRDSTTAEAPTLFTLETAAVVAGDSGGAAACAEAGAGPAAALAEAAAKYDPVPEEFLDLVNGRAQGLSDDDEEEEDEGFEEEEEGDDEEGEEGCEELEEEQGECWHEVWATLGPHPHNDRDVLILAQHDVSAKVVAERHLARVMEAEHRLLEQLFPRHILQHMAEQGAVRPPAGTGEGGGRSGRAGLGRGGGGGGGLARRGSGLARLHSGLPPQPPVAAPDCNALATAHEAVTLLFADIKSFTPLCSSLAPADVMRMLNDLFSRFDANLDRLGVFKVETIGDCYFVAGGLVHVDADGMAAVRGEELGALHHDPRDAARRVFAFAQAMLAAAACVPMPGGGGEAVQLRVGIHTGPVVSGVVGTRMPRFCLFGDTVNTASRMESTGVPGAVHVSAAAHALLAGEADWQPTGGVEVKGKGVMSTYLWRPTGQSEADGVQA